MCALRVCRLRAAESSSVSRDGEGRQRSRGGQEQGRRRRTAPPTGQVLAGRRDSRANEHRVSAASLGLSVGLPPSVCSARLSSCASAACVSEFARVCRSPFGSTARRHTEDGKTQGRGNTRRHDGRTQQCRAEQSTDRMQTAAHEDRENVDRKAGAERRREGGTQREERRVHQGTAPSANQHAAPSPHAVFLRTVAFEAYPHHLSLIFKIEHSLSVCVPCVRLC